jgi:Ser/Thr protein kinase RdoA (MazF antagonist)
MIEIFKINEYFGRDYPNLGEVVNGKIFQKNTNSFSFLINTKKNSYVLHKFTDNSSIEKIEKICQIVNFCYKQHPIILQPIKNKNNLFVDKKNKMFLTKYVKGSIFQDTKKEIQDVAKNIAILHKILRKNKIDYNYRTNQKFYKILTDMELKNIEKEIVNKSKKDRADIKILKNINYIKKRISTHRDLDGKIKGLKKQLIHNDLHPENILFYKNKVTGIIDFNAMKNGDILEDISFASFRFASYHNSDSQEIIIKMKIFLDNYSKTNKIDGVDLNQLNYFTDMKIFERISYILKKKYFIKNPSWEQDIDKQLNYLNINDKLSKIII